MPSSGSNPEAGRKPYSYSVVHDIGMGYGIGAVAGSVFSFGKGIYDSPNGQRFIGGTQAVRMNFGRWGGRIAVVEGILCTFEHTMIYLRQKDDPWNTIVAFGGTAGLLMIRQGLGPACRTALFFGAFQAMLQGGGAMVINKVEYEELELKHKRVLKGFEAERLARERKSKIFSFLN